MRLPTPLATLVATLLIALPALADTARVRRDGAQLRAATGFTGAVLASPAQGDLLELLEVSNEWRRVRTEAGREGWVHELFLEKAERRERPRPAPPRPGAQPRAEPFEPPAVEERLETAPAAELERLRGELARERAARTQAERELAQARAANEGLRGDLLASEGRLERGAGELADLQAAVRESRIRLADQRAQLRGESEDELSRALAAKDREHAAALEAGERRHALELAAAAKEHEAAIAEARSANAAEIAELQQRLRAEQDRIGESFVENCTELHRRELTRKEAEWQASCEERLGEMNAAHQKELRKARKESGWEQEFEREVREAVRSQVEERLTEAKLRWEAKRRGDAVELEKELAKQQSKLESECESRVLSAVNAELERHRVEMNDNLRALQAEEERRCKAALELVLQRQAAGPAPGDRR